MKSHKLNSSIAVHRFYCWIS